MEIVAMRGTGYTEPTEAKKERAHAVRRSVKRRAVSQTERGSESWQIYRVATSH